MAKRITDRERLLTFAMRAGRDDLQVALEIIRTALATRFPTPRRTTPKRTEKTPNANAAANTP